MERRVLLLVAKRGRSQVALARLFGVSRRCIQKDLEAIKREVRRALDLESVIGGLVLAADDLAARAVETDPGTAWRIRKELVEVLLELGIIGPVKPEGERMSITVETLAANYERARTTLTQALDPRLTGEVRPEA